MFYEILASAIASTTTVSVPPPLPPISRATRRSARNRLAIISFMPNAVRCNGEQVHPIFAPRPKPSALSSYVLSSRRWRNKASDFDIGFTITKTGRTRAIEKPILTRARAALRESDVAPALATWKFAPTKSERKCILNVKITAKPLDTAAPSDIYRSWALRSTSNARLRKLLFNKIVPANSNCYKIRRTTLLKQHRPDYQAIKGERSFSVYSYDIGKNGRTKNIKILESDSNKKFDDAVRSAVSKNVYSRQSNPARNGCVGYFSKGVEQFTVTPDAPENNTVQNAKTCTLSNAKWKTIGKKIFPKNFAYRGVNGWAYLRFDVAPWGQISNIRVVNAEPSSKFGDAAKRILRTARLPKSDRGHTGCVKRIDYKLQRKELQYSKQDNLEVSKP